MSDAGFLIGDTLFPFAANFTFMDAPLVREVTGLEFGEFAERVDALGDNSSDLLAVTGLVAIAIARAEPTWNRPKIIHYLAGVDVTTFDVQIPDVGPVEGDAGPPAQEGSPISSDESTISAADSPEEPG